MSDDIEKNTKLLFCMGIRGLPSEIHLHLLTFLDWQSLKALRLSANIFAQLLSIVDLKVHYLLCSTFVYEQEKQLRRLVEAEYWVAAEQAFLGIGYHNYSSSHDPDLDAIQKRRSCSSDKLPCYRCLRWLPSSTSEDKFASASHFSRTRSTLDFDLDGKRARDRNCIDCGLRSGMYRHGTIVKHNVICVNCGKLGKPIPNWTWSWSFNSHGCGRDYFCDVCYTDQSVHKMADEQYWHERQFGKYDVGLRKGKAYRLEKGRLLREEKGITIEDNLQGGSIKLGDQGTTDCTIPIRGRNWHGGPRSSDRGPNAGYCPIMQDMRFCFCGGWNPPWQRTHRQ